MRTGRAPLASQPRAAVPGLRSVALTRPADPHNLGGASAGAGGAELEGAGPRRGRGKGGAAGAAGPWRWRPSKVGAAGGGEGPSRDHAASGDGPV